MRSYHRKTLLTLLVIAGSAWGGPPERVMLPFLGRPVPPTGATAPERTEIRFENHRSHRIFLFWINDRGERVAYGQLEPGRFKIQSTYPGHVWMITDAAGYPLGHFIGRKIFGIARISNQ